MATSAKTPMNEPIMNDQALPRPPVELSMTASAMIWAGPSAIAIAAGRIDPITSPTGRPHGSFAPCDAHLAYAGTASKTAASDAVGTTRVDRNPDCSKRSA